MEDMTIEFVKGLPQELGREHATFVEKLNSGACDRRKGRVQNSGEEKSIRLSV